MKINLQFVRTVKKKYFLQKLGFTVISSFLLLGISQNALALTKPTLQSPTNNSQITTPSVTFSWSHPYNDQYEVKIKTSGGTLKYASGKTSSKSKTVNLSSIHLTSGSTYIWYVVVYASGQEISSADSLFTYKFAGRVDLSGGLNVSPSNVTVGQNFTVSFSLKEFQGGAKTFEYVQLWIQNSAGGDLYMAQQWSNETFAANQQKSYSATTSLNPAQGRSAGTYRAIVRGKVAGEAPFNFGVVGGSGAVTPKTFTAVAAASPPPPSPSQPPPSVPAPAVQPKPVVSGRVDLSGGVNVSPSNVTVGQNFTVSFSLKEFQGGAKTFEYVQLWIQNSSGGDLYMAQQWNNESFAANQQKSYSATTNLNPAQGRSAGTYRAIVRGKVAGEAPFNFGVVGGSGAVTPRTFTAVAVASPPPLSPAPAVQPKPVVSGRVDLSGGVNVSPSSVTIGQNFTVTFNLKEFQGGAKTFEYVQLWIQNSSGGDLYMAQHWSNVAFAAHAQRRFSATTSLNPAQERSAGTYLAIVRGKVAGEAPFNFGVVSGSGAANPKTFTAPPPLGGGTTTQRRRSPLDCNNPPCQDWINRKGYCVYYVREKIKENNPNRILPTSLFAINIRKNKDNKYVAPGDAAIFRFGKYGHVAYVEKVNRDQNGNITSIDVTEMNYGGIDTLDNFVNKWKDEFLKIKDDPTEAEYEFKRATCCGVTREFGNIKRNKYDFNKIDHIWSPDPRVQQR